MAVWITPRTWTNTTLTAADMNSELRDKANWLKSAVDLITGATAADSGTATWLDIVRPAVGDGILRGRISGDSSGRFQVNADGEHVWGPGGAAAIDTTLERVLAGTLRLSAASSVLRLQTTGQYAALRFDNAAGAARALMDYGTGGSDDMRFGLSSGAAGSETFVEYIRLAATTGRIKFSKPLDIGNNLILDPTLGIIAFGSGAQILTGIVSTNTATAGFFSIDGQWRVADGITTKVVAGAVNDGAFSYGTPVSGTIAIDTAFNGGVGRIMVRVGATWRAVALA